MRYKQPKQYLDAGRRRARRCRKTPSSTRKDIGFEFMLNALRLTDGVPASLFAERTGYPLALVGAELAEAERRGLIERDPATIRPTALGRRFLNDLQQLFLRLKRAVQANEAREEAPAVRASPKPRNPVARSPLSARAARTARRRRRSGAQAQGAHAGEALRARSRGLANEQRMAAP